MLGLVDLQSRGANSKGGFSRFVSRVSRQAAWGLGLQQVTSSLLVSALEEVDGCLGQLEAAS